MKITLRKAAAVQTVINEFLNGSALETSASIGRYDTPSVVIAKASGVFEGVLEQKLSLTKTLYSLRKKASAASHKAGIPDILADIAYLDKQLVILGPLVAVNKFAPDEAVVAEQFADLKAEASQPNSYRRNDSFEVSLLSVERVQAFMGDLSTIRKQKQNLSDRLLELNIKNEIELDDNEYQVLKGYDLI